MSPVRIVFEGFWYGLSGELSKKPLDRPMDSPLEVRIMSKVDYKRYTWQSDACTTVVAFKKLDAMDQPMWAVADDRHALAVLSQALPRLIEEKAQ